MSEEYTWYPTPYGEYRIYETRFGLFTSVKRDGTKMVTGGTREAVLSMTPGICTGRSTDTPHLKEKKLLYTTVSSEENYGEEIEYNYRLLYEAIDELLDASEDADTLFDTLVCYFAEEAERHQKRARQFKSL